MSIIEEDQVISCMSQSTAEEIQKSLTQYLETLIEFQTKEPSFHIKIIGFERTLGRRLKTRAISIVLSDRDCLHDQRRPLVDDFLKNYGGLTYINSADHDFLILNAKKALFKKTA